MRDRILVYTAAFLRSAGIALTGVILAIYLDRSGFGGAQIGAIVALGLAGGAVATGLISLFADRLGRRRTLILLALFAGAGGVGLGFTAHFLPLLLIAFFGMANGMGRDRSAAYIIEQATLSCTSTTNERTRVLAGYHAVTDVGAALGSLAAALPSLLGYKLTWLIYASAMGAGVLLYMGLSRSVEVTLTGRAMSPESQRRIVKFAGISTIDSLGSGFLTGALLAFFFYKRFGLSEEHLAGLFFAARIANALSNFGAAWLAERIGLINTMVFTHIPGSLLLMVVPFLPTFSMAAVVFIMRELLVEMDVPTRQSYLASIVTPEERTAAMGTVQLTRTATWAVAPTLAGWMMKSVALATPLYLGASIKIAHDLVLWRAFRRLRPT